MKELDKNKIKQSAKSRNLGKEMDWEKAKEKCFALRIVNSHISNKIL